MRENLQNRLAYYKAHWNKDKHELLDFCSTSVADTDALFAKALDGSDEGGSPYMPHPEFQKTRKGLAGAGVTGGGKILKNIRGMGTIYDWRDSPWTPSNGGKINPLVMVQHIPVVPNMVGIADFVRLRDVLVAQGLMVQQATDRDGNIALYTPMDALCYQARGANQLSTGIEHMHMSVGEDWSKKQLRAAAWIVSQGIDKCQIPAFWGSLGNGDGVVRVLQRGQTTHKLVSQKAGYNDRVDPGDRYDAEYVRHAVTVWRQRVKEGIADSKGMEGI